MKPEKNYDIIVVGGGHAGIEAAHAGARLGCPTLLLTMDAQALGRMSCNPAMGGLGKGHALREIDALGGIQALATDANGLQFRLLNRSKGPAVQAPRVQCDKDAYQLWMSRFLKRVPKLTVLEGEASEILVEGDAISGIRVNDGTAIRCRALILTTGTFLDSVMHCGLEQTEGGRVGERSANLLSRSFLSLGLETGRLKTGTPCRLDRDSIDFSKCEEQQGDDPPPPVSFRTEKLELDQMPCYLTATNERTHAIIRDNLDRSPLFTGKINSIGPRYCPSIEDKVVRFEEKTSHQIFLEPETRGGNTIYPNGISTSLPADVQEAYVRSVPGLENARFAKYGYAVEYTYIPPRQLHHTLETKSIPGLYLAGQINGTSGYEEAGGQGLMAGINAALKIQNEEPFVLRRDEAYLGVMIDDLLTKDHREPYRLFTSRAEYRLLLRADNTDLRLLDHAERLGMLPPEQIDHSRSLAGRLGQRVDYFKKNTIRPHAVDWERAAEVEAPRLDQASFLSQYLRRPEVTIEMLRHFLPELDGFGESDRLWKLLETEIKYEGYLEKQADLVRRTRDAEETPLPEDLDYSALASLRAEAVQVLEKFRPDTLGAAGRLAGVNPSDVACLLIELKRRERGSREALSA